MRMSSLASLLLMLLVLLPILLVLLPDLLVLLVRVTMARYR